MMRALWVIKYEGKVMNMIRIGYLRFLEDRHRPPGAGVPVQPVFLARFTVLNTTGCTPIHAECLTFCTFILPLTSQLSDH